MFLNNLFPDPPLGQVPSRDLSLLLAGEEIMVIFRGRLVDLEEEISFGEFFFLGGRKFFGRKFYPVTLGQFFHGLGKGKLAHLHQEGEYISPFSTAEAVEDLFLLVDHEGGGLFRMEGAESLVVSSGFFEGYDSPRRLLKCSPVLEPLKPSLRRKTR